MQNPAKLIIATVATGALCFGIMACASEDSEDRQTAPDEYSVQAGDETKDDLGIVEWRVNTVEETVFVTGVDGAGDTVVNVEMRLYANLKSIKFTNGGELTLDATGEVISDSLTQDDYQALFAINRDLNIADEFGWRACGAVPGLGVAAGLACAANAATGSDVDAVRCACCYANAALTCAIQQCAGSQSGDSPGECNPSYAQTCQSACASIGG